MSVRVKICGVRRPADVAACVAAGADWLGLNRVPGRHRCVSRSQARSLVAVAPQARYVGVYQDAQIEVILEDIAALSLTAVQLHGAVVPEAIAALAAVAQVVVAVPYTTPPEQLRGLPISAVLVDAERPGSGQRWHGPPLGSTWNGRPTFLAGGLAPESVAHAIAHHHPAGVDVASGVEGVDGSMCPRRVERFVAAARRASAHPPAPRRLA